MQEIDTKKIEKYFYKRAKKFLGKNAICEIEANREFGIDKLTILVTEIDSLDDIVEALMETHKRFALEQYMSIEYTLMKIRDKKNDSNENV